MVASPAMSPPGIPSILPLLVLLAAAPAQAEVGCTESEERGGARPTLSGPTQTLDSEDGSFRIHWTDEGSDAPTGRADTDGNGQPDFLDRILTGLTVGQESYREQGWREVAPDDGAEGTDAVDVYVLGIDANGYAFQTPAAEGGDAGSSCAIHLSSSLGDSLDGILESVAAHELHHCVQYAYTTGAPSWMLEATATHQQYRVFSSPALQAALQILWIGRLSQPQRPLHDLGGRYEYAGFVFLHFWESFGELDRGRPPLLWEALREADGDWIAALDAESERLFGRSFARTFSDYSTWNTFACGRDDGSHYDPVLFPCTLPDTSVPISLVDGDLQLELPQVPYTAAYAEILPEGDERPVELTCGGVGEDGARAQVRLLSLDRFLRAAEVVDASARGDEPFVVRLDDPLDVAGSVLVVVTSSGLDPVRIDCTVQRVEPVLPEPPSPPPPDAAGCGCAGTGEPAASALLLLGLGVLPKRRRRRFPDAVARV